jgi:hypothetical protein
LTAVTSVAIKTGVCHLSNHCLALYSLKLPNKILVTNFSP